MNTSITPHTVSTSLKALVEGRHTVVKFIPVVFAIAMEMASGIFKG